MEEGERMHRRRRVLGLIFATAALIGIPATAQGAPPTDTTALQQAVVVGNGTSGIREHLRHLQLIADQPGANGTRATGTQGHEDSVRYVIGQLDPTYWNVTTQPFSADVFTELGPPNLVATPAASPAWVANQDYATMEFSGTGSVSGASIAIIDFVEPTAQASASSAGCEDADFPAGATSLAGKIAVIQRGTCDFGLKAINAEHHDAAGVLIFNEGTLGDPDRNGPIGGTIGGYGVTIPVLESPYLVGRYLVDHPSATVVFSAAGRTDTLETRNVIAESKSGRSDRVVISGAHLDSVPAGPGINDDGSGTATQIEVAQQMALLKINLRNKVRFIWFSGEEQGLFGSTFNADGLTKVERGNVLAMLDFDMLASPNFALQIYDGDGSEFGVAGPKGSGVIEKVFQDFFDARGLYTERIAFDGRSDYDEYTTVGIPAGGIATGAEVHKTAFQQSKWGGVVDDSLAGQFDPCYHLACDSYGINGHPDNINDEALDIMSDAVANAVLTFAQTTSATNGTGKGSPSSTKPYDWKGNKLRR
jgi:Zn-dependent M28 family amino/carboxypeptidase